MTPAPLIAGTDGKVSAGTVFRVEGTGEVREVVWAMSAGDFLEALADERARNATPDRAHSSTTGLLARFGPMTVHDRDARERQVRKWVRLGRRGERPRW